MNMALGHQFQYPPDFQKARKHRLARRIFKGSTSKSEDICECCNRKVGEEEVETNCNIDTKQLSFLGPGIPLFFLFLKSTIIMLLLMTIIFSSFCIYSNMASSDCSLNTSCKDNSFNQISIVNKYQQQSLLSIQNYLALAYVIVAILFFHYLRYQARKLEQECDQIIDSPSDYAIVLRRLPSGTTEKDVMDMVESKRKDLTEQQRQQTQNLKVVKVVMSYYLRPYVTTKENNKKSWYEAIKSHSLDKWKPEDLPEPKDTSQIAIVVFEHQSTKDLFIYKPKCTQNFIQFFCTACQPLSELTVRGHQVGIERAPEPDQIYWQNSGITIQGSIGRKVGFGLVSVLILLMGGMAQFGLAILNKQATSDIAKTLFQFANPVIVMTWNTIILIAIILMTEKERNETITEFQAVLVVKITLLQFFNAGVFVVVCRIAANLDTFDVGGGIIEQITTIMTLNAITPNIMNFAKNYFEIFNRVELWLVKKGCCIRSQAQVNKASTGTISNMPRRYAYILKTLLLTALYAPVAPVVVPLALLGMIIFYFIEKMLYTRSYAMPHTISAMTFKSSIELLEYFLITFALGQFIIYAYFYSYEIGKLPTTWLIVICITLGLALLNSALPMDAINEKLFAIEESSRSSLKYSDIEEQFEVTYEMFNPAYKSKRQRSSNKDLIGEMMNHRVIQDTADMVDIMNLATAENQKEQKKAPLLGELVFNLGADTPAKIKHHEEELVKAKKREEIEICQQKQEEIDQLHIDKKDQKSPLNLIKSQKDQAYIKPQQKVEETLSFKKPSPKKQSTRFRYLDIKEGKKTDKSSYQNLIKKLMPKKQLKNEDSFTRQTSLLFQGAENEPKQKTLEKQVKKKPAGQIQMQMMHSQALSKQKDPQPIQHQNPQESALSISQQPLVAQDAMKKTFQQLAFPEPQKQKLATYDPIGIKEGYRGFFNSPDKMIKQEGNYLNSKVVVQFLGTPFASLLKGIGDPVSSQDNKSKKSDQPK